MQLKVLFDNLTVCSLLSFPNITGQKATNRVRQVANVRLQAMPRRVSLLGHANQIGEIH